MTFRWSIFSEGIDTYSWGSNKILSPFITQTVKFGSRQRCSAESSDHLSICWCTEAAHSSISFSFLARASTSSRRANTLPLLRRAAVARCCSFERRLRAYFLLASKRRARTSSFGTPHGRQATSSSEGWSVKLTFSPTAVCYVLQGPMTRCLKLFSQCLSQSWQSFAFYVCSFRVMCVTSWLTYCTIAIRAWSGFDLRLQKI